MWQTIIALFTTTGAVYSVSEESGSSDALNILAPKSIGFSLAGMTG